MATKSSASKSQDLSSAQRLLTEVFGYYKHQATPFEATLWNRLIDEFGDPPIERFLSQHVQRSCFAPRVNDAMAVLNPGAGDSMSAMLTLHQAIARVGPYGVPDFSADPAIAAAVADLGGWVVVNTQMPEASDRFAWDAFYKRFDVAYRGACGRLAFQSAAVPRLRGLHDVGSSVLALQSMSGADSPVDASLVEGAPR
ncbi:hypothetical protein QRD43_20555 [Pelomonas sp. APW6]|uniref:Uncharacterized protein n=1 Tax=Roseateles subflavus TaxID=3053353 RepID=A0ABT7LRF0_9BURK|nr:hypothetical protein [Pelomonas sp. APW6]MDL5034305.1 hypothetical protein [Pelomonas sp. APW6]